jgi:hypothetical protein
LESPEEKRPLVSLWRRWQNEIKIKLKEIASGWGVWSGFTWLRIGIVGVLS